LAPPVILIIDDNPQICRSIAQNFEIRGFDSLKAHSSHEALQILVENHPKVILLDLALGEESGLDLLKELQKQYSSIPVIMITGHGSVVSAVEAMKCGAQDFIQKPIQFESLFARVEQCIKFSKLKEEHQDLQKKIKESTPIIQTKSQKVLQLLEQAQKLSETNIPVMVQGESGTGKELMAEYIHSHSARKFKPFKQVNCAALAESLLDDELFGHEKGAFTGATQRRKGLFESAHQGTLHLDEIGDMALNTQAKVLRVIQNKELRRLGGTENIKVDIRLIASTNKNLEQMVQQGSFREDLYYRLNVANLQMLPLCQRVEDLDILCPDILKEFAFEHNRKMCSISANAMERILAHPWPGNIRELKNVLQVAATLCKNDLIEPQDLQLYHQNKVPNPQIRDHTQHSHTNSHRQNDVDEDQMHEHDMNDQSLKGHERDIIQKVLLECGGNKSQAADKLSISRKTLYNKISKYGL
jgi:DNA-binding NtrC family response regulator